MDRGGGVNVSANLEEQGAGWRSLIAAVLLLAIYDADFGDNEAEGWLQGEGAENCLTLLGLPFGVDYLARRKRYPKKKRRRRLPVRPSRPRTTK